MAKNNVLVIDDDESLLRVIQDKLKINGLNPICATDGNVGWNMTLTEKPDLIVLDIMLGGGMNGFDFLERLKKDARTAQIPVIILTNLDNEDKVAKEIGADDYFVKTSTDLNLLSGRIKSILDNKA